MPVSLRSRLDALAPAVLLLAGTVALVGGGRRHPHVGASLGAVGSPAYFSAFAEAVLATPGWQVMHALILAGPVLWALGVAGIAPRVGGGGSSLAGVARSAFAIGAALWGVTFVLDGFIAPRLARVLLAAPTNELHAAPLAAFAANQAMVAHLGGLGLILLGAGTAAVSAGLLAQARLRAPSTVFALAGLLLGAWPLVATLTGEFTPGPFTSPLWIPTALALGVWFVGLAAIVVRDVVGGRPTGSAAGIYAGTTP